MRKIVYNLSDGKKIESLRIDGITIGISGIENVIVETDCGLWEFHFKDNTFIYSTGNIFICLKPVS